MLSAETLDITEYRRRLNRLRNDRKFYKIIEETPHQGWRNAIPFFCNQQSIQNLVRPERRNDRPIASREHLRDAGSDRVIFIGETPSQHHRGVENEAAHCRPEFMRSLIFRLSVLGDRKDSLCRFPKLLKRSAAPTAEPLRPGIRSFSHSPNSRDTLVLRRAASILAQLATSSSRVTVTLRKRFPINLDTK